MGSFSTRLKPKCYKICCISCKDINIYYCCDQRA